jgi:hypothetical protein
MTDRQALIRRVLQNYLAREDVKERMAELDAEESVLFHEWLACDPEGALRHIKPDFRC